MRTGKFTLSLILPCYNITPYISDCIASICKAAQGHENEIEVILIDDGSTDHLEEKLKGLYKGTLDFKYYRYENAGTSTARNRGINKATGMYMWFIDPDDTITENSLSILLSLISGGGDAYYVSLNVKDGFNCFTDRNPLLNMGHKLNLKKSDIYKYVIPLYAGFSQKNLDRLYCGKTISDRGAYNGQMAHIIYRRDIIIKNNINFNSCLNLSEDVMFALRYLAYADSMIITDDICYNYYLRESGALRNILHHNVRSLVSNKKELAQERQRISQLYLEREGIDIRPLYLGSLVLTCVELAVNLSSISFKGWRDFHDYLTLMPVQNAIRNLSVHGAPLKFKVPFLLLKLRCYRLLYTCLWIANRAGMRLYV